MALGLLVTVLAVLLPNGVTTGMTVSFAPAANLSVGSAPEYVAIGDLNSDSKPDLAVANEGSNSVTVRLGTGTGSFGPATSFPAGSSPRSVAIGDFNSDGKPDLAVPNAFSGNVSILLGAGDGTFGPGTTLGSVLPMHLAIADFNGDGKLDLAVANRSPTNSVSIHRGNADGTFAAPQHFFVEADFPRAVVVADLNGDGKLDFATANSGSSNISVRLGNGAGAFGAAMTFAVALAPVSLSVADLDGDGVLDLAVPLQTPAHSVVTLFGHGDGTFAAPTYYGLGGSSHPRRVAIVDLNGDASLDLAVTESGGDSDVAVLLGTGAGSFGPATTFAAGATPFGVATGDLNADGRPDLAVTNLASSNVSILLNTTTTPDAIPPVVTISTDASDALDLSSGWYNVASSGTDGVGVDVSATDESGVANITCTDGATEVLNVSSSSGSFTPGDGEHSISCQATDSASPPNTGAAAGSTAMPVIYKVDQSGPDITVTAPVGTSYLANSVHVADYACSDATSPPPSCDGDVADGATFSTAPGTHTFTVDATDQAGNPVSSVVSYAAAYTFSQFSSPIDNALVNTAKAGQIIPVKWRLLDANGPISDPASFVSLTSTQGSGACAGLPADALEEYAGSIGLQYNGDGNWQFNWKTPKSYAGQCRTMRLNLADQAPYTAAFRFS